MRIQSLSLLLSLLLLPVLGACDDDPKSNNNANNANNVNNVNNVNNANNLPGPLAGELVLDEYDMISGAYSRLTGVVGAGGFPVWQEEYLAAGDCRLFRFVSHFCEDYCEGVCVGENLCEPWPTFIDAGRLTITGAKQVLATDPSEYGWFGANGYGWWGDAPELFDDLDPITASFAGGDVPAFSVTAAGVAPLVLTGLVDDELDLPNGRDTFLTWEPGPSAGTRVRVTLNANSSGGHGSPYEAYIECDTEDDGDLTIPEDLVEAFPDAYRWEMCAGQDCPLSWAMRYRRGTHQMNGGTFDFRVGSSVAFFILHDALQP